MAGGALEGLQRMLGNQAPSHQWSSGGLGETTVVLIQKEQVCGPKGSNNSMLRMLRRSIDHSGQAFLRMVLESNTDDLCF